VRWCLKLCLVYGIPFDKCIRGNQCVPLISNFRKSCILSIWKSKIFIKNRGFSSRSDEKFPFTVLYNKNLLRTRPSVISDISGTHWLPRIHLSKGIPYTRHNLRHHIL
jgi:hypothetical protein